ncbi:DNA-directed RNA polymerase III subunit Rpc5 [Crepidotus variabilis]|uniref:DNA-directed RNA polymerase III subunit Rpc5 n=1 Tax=Crepidotus variabilis TaxID=179855 RepID=A0A9P6JTS5_9AGAR|nr:DNA-directed RNA polymerase III subunit Rpc5 [Crepidotus variabilis]
MTMDVGVDDELVSVLPIHFSNALSPNIQIHQFPLLTRPLQVPPSAEQSGKFIKARIKPGIKRLEIHVPADTRTDVYNLEKSKNLGAARLEDDKVKNQENKDKAREEDPRLSEVRLRSEEVVQKGSYVLAVIRNGKMHFHPVSEIHQLRPTLTYLDILSRKSKRSRGGDSDSDSDGPPPDPDDPIPVAPVKKEKKPTGEAKEVHVTAKKADDTIGQGGLSAGRREMLHHLRLEEEEKWEDLQFFDASTEESSAALESLFSQTEEELKCTSDLTTFLTSIKGL